MTASAPDESQTPAGLLLYWDLGSDVSPRTLETSQSQLRAVIRSCMSQYLNTMLVANGYLQLETLLQGSLLETGRKPGRRGGLTGARLVDALDEAVRGAGNLDDGVRFGRFPELTDPDTRAWRRPEVLDDVLRVRASSYTNPWWEVLTLVEDYLMAGGVGVAAAWTFKNASGLMDLLIRAGSFKSEAAAKKAENEAAAAEAELRRLQAVRAQLELAGQVQAISRQAGDLTEVADVIASLGHTKVAAALAARNISNAIPRGDSRSGDPRIVAVSESAVNELRKSLLPAHDQALGVLGEAASTAEAAGSPPASAASAEPA